MTKAPPGIEDVLALSPLQEGLFALYRMAEDGLDLYTMQLQVDIDGPVDVGLLRRSAAALLDRHPNLRAAFWDRDVPKPVQIVPTHVELPWAERSARPTEFDAIAHSERRRPFDLGRGPALRVVLLTSPDGSRRRMVFTAHHILMDGWSMAVYFTEMLAVYRAGGSTDGLPAPRPYRDYIAWLAGQDTEAALAKWTAYLAGASAPLMLAEDSVSGNDAVPAATTVVLSTEETARLRTWAGRNGLTLNTAVLFGWAVLLSRLTDRRDVVFGTIVSGRPDQLAGVESMVGLFINSLPVVHRVSGDTSAVAQCQQLQRESSALRDIGYLSLSELQRAHGRGALFDTMFVFENAPMEDAIRTVTTPDGAAFTPVEGESLTHYPLTVVSHLSGDELVVVVEAIPAALPHYPAAEVCERLVGVLRQLPDIGDATPDALDVLTASERAAIGELAAADAPEGTIWEAFELQAHATPDALALTAGTGERLTYAELHAQARRLAAELAGRGVGPETIVALALPRSTRSIVAILAVLAAGGAYLPVDVTLPQARIASMVRQARPVLALTVGGHAVEGVPTLDLSELADDGDPAAPAVLRHPAQAAYVIFTSGSTGEPKGVVGTNAAVLGYLADHRDRIYRRAVAELGRPLRIAHAWSLSFDASWQPMVGLLDGQSLHLFDSEEMRDAQRLVAGMAEHEIDMIDTTPSMLAQLRAAGMHERALAVLALGGEAINTALWEHLRALPDTAVFNCYGPTETTVEAVVAAVKDYPAPTIGTANAGTHTYVLDSALRLTPTGVVGELYLSGAQLTRGYIGRPGQTAGTFVADPFRPGRRMYRTGDLVRRLPHGGYAYVGRADAQVKVRGYRVEIGEIETALRNTQQVADAAVSVLRRDGGASLVGFVVWQPDTDGDPVALRAALTERLPSYMVPARIVALPVIPVNANGKQDGHVLDTLAADALAAIGSRDGSASASTDTERALCAIFAEQFDGTAPHVDDDFFALGLDSIVAISFVTKARRRGITMSPRMMLASPSIRMLAAAIDSAASEPATDDAGYGEVPPLPMLTWLCEHGGYRRFTHNFLLRLPPDVDRASIEAMLQLLLDGHDTLRSVLVDHPDGPRLLTREPGVVRAADLLTEADGELLTDVERFARHNADQIDPRTGAMMRAVRFTGADHVLLLSAHHLTVDVVSWHILLADVAEAARATALGDTPKTLPEFTSYRRFCELMAARADTAEVTAQRDYWAARVQAADDAIGARHPDPARDTWSSLRVTRTAAPADVTATLLGALSRDEGVREILLAATAMTIASWRRERGRDAAVGALVSLEGHGRADALLGTDTTNTVGSFISSYPVRLGVGAAAVSVEQAERDPASARALLDTVVAELAAIPFDGLDYGLLRYVRRDAELAVEPQIQFSYLGRLDLGGDRSDTSWSLLGEPYVDALPLDPEPDLPLRFALHLSALVATTADGTQLVTNVRWSDALFGADDVERLSGYWQRSLAALATALR